MMPRFVRISRQGTAVPRVAQAVLACQGEFSSYHAGC